MSGGVLTASTSILTCAEVSRGSNPVLTANLLSCGKLPPACSINASGTPLAAANLFNLSSPVNHPSDLRSISASNLLRCSLYCAALFFASAALRGLPFSFQNFCLFLFLRSSFCNLLILFLLCSFSASFVSFGGTEKPSIKICAECVQLG